MNRALCTYRLNWARRTSWGWWDDTVLQTQDSKFEPCGLRPSTLPHGHAGSPQYWLSHVDGEETFFVSFKPTSPETEPRALAWKAAVLTTTLGPLPLMLFAMILSECQSSTDKIDGWSIQLVIHAVGSTSPINTLFITGTLWCYDRLKQWRYNVGHYP